MRAMTTRLVARLAGLSLLGGLLLASAPALAAPAITITPGAVARGGEVAVSGNGFSPDAPLAAVLEVENGRRVPAADFAAAPDGTFLLPLKIPASAPGGGPVGLLILSRPDGAVLARGDFAVTDALPVTAEQVTVAPAAGAVGTRFVVTGSGFPPGESLRLAAAPTATGAQTPPERQVDLGTIRVGADGRFTVPLDSTRLAAEPYDVVAIAAALGPPYVARFTVTPRGAVGLPRTGGPHAGGPWAPWQAVVLLAAWGAALAGAGARRWAMRRRACQPPMSRHLGAETPW